jgi:hypothetical protein
MMAYEWKYKLGARNQYKNAPYVVFEGGLYWCLLCETGGMGRKNVTEHTNGYSHGHTYDCVKKLEAADTLQKKADRMQIPKVRVEKLGARILAAENESVNVRLFDKRLCG